MSFEVTITYFERALEHVLFLAENAYYHRLLRLEVAISTSCRKLIDNRDVLVVRKLSLIKRSEVRQFWEEEDLEHEHSEFERFIQNVLEWIKKRHPNYHEYQASNFDLTTTVKPTVEEIKQLIKAKYPYVHVEIGNITLQSRDTPFSREGFNIVP